MIGFSTTGVLFENCYRNYYKTCNKISFKIISAAAITTHSIWCMREHIHRLNFSIMHIFSENNPISLACVAVLQLTYTILGFHFQQFVHQFSCTGPRRVGNVAHPASHVRKKNHHCIFWSHLRKKCVCCMLLRAAFSFASSMASAITSTPDNFLQVCLQICRYYRYHSTGRTHHFITGKPSKIPGDGIQFFGLFGIGLKKI